MFLILVGVELPLCTVVMVVTLLILVGVELPLCTVVMVVTLS